MIFYWFLPGRRPGVDVRRTRNARPEPHGYVSLEELNVDPLIACRTLAGVLFDPSSVQVFP